MSTPSETMLTATIHGSRELREVGELLRAARVSVCRTMTGARPVTPRAAAWRSARACVGSAAITRPPASRCPPARSARELGVGLREDPRQAVGQLGRDRRPVAATRPRERSATSRSATRSRRRRCARTASRRRRRTRPGGRCPRGPRRRRCRRRRARRRRRRRSARPGSASASERNGVPDSSSQREPAPNAVAKPSPQASSSPRWWASSAMTSVSGDAAAPTARPPWRPARR